MQRNAVTVGLTADEINAVKAMVAANSKTNFDEQVGALIMSGVASADSELIEAAKGLLAVCDRVHGISDLDIAAGRLWQAVFKTRGERQLFAAELMYQHNVRTLGDGSGCDAAGDL